MPKFNQELSFFLEQTNFNSQINKGIDLIITGEGSIDKQTLEGKVIKGIGAIAIQNNIPFYIIAGIVKDKYLLGKNLKPSGINSIMELDVSFEDAIKNASKYINEIANDIVRNLKNDIVNR
jgi:glycerate kinase